MTVHQLVDTLLDLHHGHRWVSVSPEFLNIARLHCIKSILSIQQESQLLFERLQIINRIFPALLWLLDFFDHLCLFGFLGRLGGRNRGTCRSFERLGLEVRVGIIDLFLFVK